MFNGILQQMVQSASPRADGQVPGSSGSGQRRANSEPDNLRPKKKQAVKRMEGLLSSMRRESASPTAKKVNKEIKVSFFFLFFFGPIDSPSFLRLEFSWKLKFSWKLIIFN